VDRLELRHATGVTLIRVGAGALQEAARDLADCASGGRLFVVTSQTVLGLHGTALATLEAVGLPPHVLSVPEGEAAKSLDVAGRLWGELVRAGAKRDSTLLAFGGGSVSDLTGFVAGTLARGVAWLGLPTTLLGQVDASIGGKTAVDLPAAKNAIGLFHHPRMVICDTSFLGSLPVRELRSGLSEVIKVATLFDATLLSDLERDLDRLLSGDPEALQPVVASAVGLKAKVVEEDPEDRGVRGLLNFGHTLGHALEAVLGYQYLTHGEAVAYGMLFSLRLAGQRGMSEEETRRLQALIGRLRLPRLPEVSLGSVLAAIAFDKKARETGLRWILPTRIGGGGSGVEVPAEDLERELRTFLAEPPGGCTNGH
jgi:3-dehydroquinate synthase